MRNKLIAPQPEVDRPATWEEICRAEVTSPERMVELFLSHGNHCESDSDFGGKIGFPAALFEFFASVNEAESTDLN
jgi:hypothetical protein